MSVLIPTFNAEATLERAVRSALDQTMRDVEVIVIDDASTDGSWGLIERLVHADSRVRAIRHKYNTGKPISMNRAAAEASGRWLAVLDADDWYHLRRLERLTSLAEAHGVDMVTDNQEFFDAAADVKTGTAWPPGKGCRMLTLDEFLLDADPFRPFSYGMLKPVFRTGFVRRTGLQYEPDARNGQDFFKLLLFFLNGGRALITDEPLYCYTQPWGALSKRWSHARRKRYDFQQVYVVNERYVNVARGRVTPVQLARLEKRSAQLRVLESFHRSQEAVAAGNILGAFSCLLENPRVAAFASRRLANRIWRHCLPAAGMAR